MSSQETAYAKTCALTTLDWDTYQIIIRTCLSADKLAGKKELAMTCLQEKPVHAQVVKDRTPQV